MEHTQVVEQSRTQHKSLLEHAKTLVTDELAEVELRLKQDADSAPQVAASAYRHMLDGGGKRLRPLIVLLAAEATGRCNGQALQAAVAIEQVHLASLMHDDVVDEARSRRGRDSVRVLLGNLQAVLAGDYLVARIYRQLAQQDSGRMLSVLAEAVVHMCQAELDAAQWHGKVPTEAQYLRTISGKTAALMQAAAHLGGLCVGASGPLQQALRRYGHNLGVAFQIRDDLSDLYGNPAALGKPTGQDLQAGLFTLSVIYALEQPGAESLQRLIEQFIAQRPEPEQTAQATQIVEHLGGREYAQQRMDHYAQGAQQALAALPQVEAVAALSQLADYVVACSQ